MDVTIQAFVLEKQKKPPETQTSCSSSEFSVLLRTAQAKVVDVEKMNSTKARLFFDSGSQMSYVTPSLKEKLSLKTVGKREMCIKTFGDARQTKVLEIVEFLVETDNGLVKVQAFVSDISYPLKGQTPNMLKKTLLI